MRHDTQSAESAGYRRQIELSEDMLHDWVIKFEKNWTRDSFLKNWQIPTITTAIMGAPGGLIKYRLALCPSIVSPSADLLWYNTMVVTDA